MTSRGADVLRLHVEERGDGPALVLLHGFTGSGADWGEHAVRLSRHFRVLTVDLPGHGRSDAPPDPNLYRLERCAEYLAGVLDSRAIRTATWVGYSMGGRTALAFALAYPERVERLVLEGASPGISDPVERQQRAARDQQLAERIEREGTEAFVNEWMRQPLFASQVRLGEERLAALRAARCANRPAGLANSLRGAGTGAQTPLWDRLHELTMPVLLVVGEEDTKFRAVATAMRERLPDARVVLIPKAGHNTHLENPVAFERAVMRFCSARETVHAEKEE